MNNNFTFNYGNDEENLVTVEKIEEVEEKKEVKPVKEKKEKKKKEKKDAGTKLIIWVLAIFFIIALVSSLGKNIPNTPETPESPTIKEETITINELKNKNYMYDIIINIDRSNELITDTHHGLLLNNENLGVKTNDSTSIWYYINNNQYYIFDNKKFNSATKEEIYEIDEKYLKIDNIISYIELGTINYTKEYKSGALEVEYHIPVSKLNITSTSIENISIIVKKDTDNIRINIDYTNLFKELERSITKISVNIVYSKIGLITDVKEEFVKVFNVHGE